MKNKKGISLIVLVITIIVMIILAASVIITLSNTGIINKANQAVNLTDSKQVQDLASLIWAEAYLDETRTDTIEKVVKDKLKEQGITEDNWNINVSDEGVEVSKNNTGNGNTASTLGELITGASDYGKTVNYKANGVTNWKVLYEDEANGYVFLITSGGLTHDWSTSTSMEANDYELYTIFRLGEDLGCSLAFDETSGKRIAGMIKNYSAYANTTDYGSYVVGAIGGPTLELIVAGWNAKGYTPQLKITRTNMGYEINDSYYVDVNNDGLYVIENGAYDLANPSSLSRMYIMAAGYGNVGNDYSYERFNGGILPVDWVIRPVVCLKSDIPAKIGSTTDYVLGS